MLWLNQGTALLCHGKLTSAEFLLNGFNTQTNSAFLYADGRAPPVSRQSHFQKQPGCLFCKQVKLQSVGIPTVCHYSNSYETSVSRLNPFLACFIPMCNSISSAPQLKSQRFLSEGFSRGWCLILLNEAIQAMNHHLCSCVSSLSFSNGLSLCVLQLGLIHSPFHVAFSRSVWGSVKTGHPDPHLRATKEAKNLSRSCGESLPAVCGSEFILVLVA